MQHLKTVQLRVILFILFFLVAWVWQSFFVKMPGLLSQQTIAADPDSAASADRQTQSESNQPLREPKP